MPWKLDGNYNLEYFLSWLDTIDQQYIIRLPRYDRVQFVADFLVMGSALEWWTRLQRYRLLIEGHFKITSQRRIKQMLRSRFIPLSYCFVRQGTRSVSNYVYEFA